MLRGAIAIVCLSVRPSLTLVSYALINGSS